MMLKEEAVTAERIALLRSWRHSGFHIDSSRRLLEGDRAGLESVLQYMERPPVALARLSSFMKVVQRDTITTKKSKLHFASCSLTTGPAHRLPAEGLKPTFPAFLP